MEPILCLQPAGWACDRNPQSTETNSTGYINQGNEWLNITTNAIYRCINQADYTDNGDGTYTSDNCQWLYCYTMTSF